MVATTPVNSLRYAQQTDVANAETAFTNLATDLDRRLLPVYATTAERDLKIPSPTEGMFCYITATTSGGKTLMGYNGSAWVPYFPKPLFAVKSADESVTSNVTLQNDDHLVLAMQTNAAYKLTGWLIVTGATAADLQFGFTFPANAGVTWSIMGSFSNQTSAGFITDLIALAYTEDTSSPTAAITPIGTAPVSSGAGTAVLIHGYVTTGATAGNLQLQWAQVNSTASASTVYKGSWMQLERVT